MPAIEMTRKDLNVSQLRAAAPADQARLAVYLGEAGQWFRQAKPVGMAGGGLPVRRHPRAAAAPRCACQVSIAAINKHLAQTSGRMRRRQGHRPVDPRRCGLAPFATTHRAREYRGHAASTLRAPSTPELNATDPSAGSGHLGVPARHLSQPLRLCHLRGDPRRALRCGSRRLECPDRQIRGHHLNWNQRLGKSQNLGRLVSGDG